MSQEIIKFDVNKATSLENSIDVKQEFQDEYYLDNKVSVSETTITDIININNSELNEYIKNDEIREHETLTPNHIKTDISKGNDPGSNNVKVEDEICSIIQIAFSNELLFCNHCHELYQDYCTKCRVLVYILNKKYSDTTYHRIRELPKGMLEAKESIGYLGIFSLKVIPENVRFGPFTGLNSTGVPLRIKGGRFVVSDDKFERLNWMQYINPARNIYEQNLFPFQYGDKLYYYTTRRIQQGEELLVYFGEEYEDNFLKNVEMEFVPIAKKDVENVFACIFCCLGFSSKEYLAEHKAVIHSETKEIFSAEELVQCPFCKIYLETNEYCEYHMNYCCEADGRHCVLPAPEAYEVKLERRSSLRIKTKRRKRGIYKCRQWKFVTMYNADFTHHTNEHCEVKIYKCRICNRRYKSKESLKTHLEKVHIDSERRDAQKYSARDNFKSNIKNIRERSLHSRADKKHCQCSKCKFQTRSKCHPNSQIKHLNRGKYKCANCKFKTYYRTYLERHMKMNHIMESNYKCTECEFETKYRASIGRHIKRKHLKENAYKCMECEFKINIKSDLEAHIKRKHLEQKKNYKCLECVFKTNTKPNLRIHIKRRHLEQNDYKCAECEFKTNIKLDLERHVKRRHLEQKKNYKCLECVFKTNTKPNLKLHIKRKHLEQNDYKCAGCEFKTNVKSDLERHIKTKHLERKKNYKCLECEFKTNIKPNLKLHIKRKHLEQNDYACAECEYKTNVKTSLETHIKTKHLKAKECKCTECEFKTKYKANLEAHIKAKHLKEKNYKCMECEYKTCYKSGLERHIKSKHLKQKDYKCTECEYEASRNSYLETHKKTKHLKE